MLICSVSKLALMKISLREEEATEVVAVEEAAEAASEVETEVASEEATEAAKEAATEVNREVAEERNFNSMKMLSQLYEDRSLNNILVTLITKIT